MFKILSLLLLFAQHPAHETLMSVEYSAENEAFMVFIKLKYDDFILDYRNSINDDQSFDQSGKIDTSIVMVEEYFNNKVQIFADGKKLDGRLTGVEYIEGELTMNFLFNNNKRARHFKVKNQILTELYENQANLLIFKYKDYEEGVKLTSANREQTFRVN